MPEATTPATPPASQPAPAKTAPPPESSGPDYEDLATRFDVVRKPAKQETQPAEKEEVASTPPKEAPKQTSPTKVKFVVDGAEVEVDVAKEFPEFADTWEKMSEPQRKRLAAMWQKDRSASRRFSEAALTKKQMAEMVHLLKTDPLAVLKHPALGHDARKIIEDAMLEFIENDNLDPKEKELRELKHKIKKQEEKEEFEKNEKAKEEIATMTAQFTKSYQADIIEALQASKLPKTSETIKSMAQYMKQALKYGARLKAADVVDLVRQDYQRKFKALFSEADAESLVEMFGQDLSEKFRKHSLKTLKTTGKMPEKQAEGGPDRKVKKTINEDEWREMIDRRAKE
jgi:hypothetical protein